MVDLVARAELDWARVERGRRLYESLPGPKVVVDAVDSVEHNLALVLGHLGSIT